MEFKFLHPAGGVDKPRKALISSVPFVVNRFCFNQKTIVEPRGTRGEPKVLELKFSHPTGDMANPSNALIPSVFSVVNRFCFRAL